MRLLSLFACASAFEPKCIACKHYIAGKCKMFPIIRNFNDTEYDYIHYSTARSSPYMCGEKGKYYEKIELSISQEKMIKK